MLSLPKAVALLTHWQHAARLCRALRERQSERAINEFTDQFELALMLSFRLDLTGERKRPPAPSIRAARERAAQPDRRRTGR